MSDKYQVALKFLRSVTARIDDSLPPAETVTPESASADITRPGFALDPDLGSLLPSLQGHISAFEQRVQAAHTLVTPSGTIELDNITPDDDTSVLLPRNTIGSDIVFNRRWRKLASVYYLGPDIAIGYMCIPQMAAGPGQNNKPIGQVVIHQVIKNARALAITRSTRLLLAVGSFSGFDRDTEDYVSNGYSNDNYLRLCLLNLGITSGFICKHSDPWVTWGIRYFIPEFSHARLEEIKKEIRDRINIPGTSIARTGISSELSCSLNYIDLAFLDLVTAGGYEVLFDPTYGPMLSKQ